MELTKSDLARMFGKSLPGIQLWISKGCPYVTKGGGGKQWVFDSAEVSAWREAQVILQAQGDTKSLDIDEARRRKLAAEAAITELELAKLRGDVIEIDAVAAVVGDDYANVRAKLLSMATKLAPQLLGTDDLPQCKALIERCVYEALEELTADGIYSGTHSETEGAEEGESQAAA